MVGVKGTDSQPVSGRRFAVGAEELHGFANQQAGIVFGGDLDGQLRSRRAGGGQGEEGEPRGFRGNRGTAVQSVESAFRIVAGIRRDPPDRLGHGRRFKREIGSRDADRVALFGQHRGGLQGGEAEAAETELGGDAGWRHHVVDRRDQFAQVPDGGPQNTYLGADRTVGVASLEVSPGATGNRLGIADEAGGQFDERFAHFAPFAATVRRQLEVEVDVEGIRMGAGLGFERAVTAHRRPRRVAGDQAEVGAGGRGQDEQRCEREQHRGAADHLEPPAFALRCLRLCFFAFFLCFLTQRPCFLTFPFLQLLTLPDPS